MKSSGCRIHPEGKEQEQGLDKRNNNGDNTIILGGQETGINGYQNNANRPCEEI
jgi:hypothetical protein